MTRKYNYAIIHYENIFWLHKESTQYLYALYFLLNKFHNE